MKDNTSCLPRLYGAGRFDSHTKFHALRISPVRAVTRYEIEIFSERGGGIYVDDRYYEIEPGLVIMKRPGQTCHSVLPFLSHFVKFEECGEELDALLRNIPEMQRFEDSEPLVRCVDAIAAAEEEPGAAGQFRLYSHLYGLLAMLARNHDAAPAGTPPTDQYRAAINRSIEYMDAHLGEACALKDLAASARFSPVYYHRLFCRIMGMTPGQYLRNRRLQTACRLLSDTDLSHTEIALRCGFGTSSYFASAFHARYGLSPKQYRRMRQQKYWS